MSLTQKVRELREHPEEKDAKNADALRRAEELADRFHDVKPKTDVASPERYMGLPAFSK